MDPLAGWLSSLTIPALPAQGTPVKAPPHKPLMLSEKHHLRETLQPFTRCLVPARKTDFDPRHRQANAVFAPGCQQAYLWPCCPEIRATPGRDVRGEKSEERQVRPPQVPEDVAYQVPRNTLPACCSQLGCRAYASGSWVLGGVGGAAWSLSSFF